MGTKRKLKASNPIPLLYGEGNSGTEWEGGVDCPRLHSKLVAELELNHFSLDLSCKAYFSPVF